MFLECPPNFAFLFLVLGLVGTFDLVHKVFDQNIALSFQGDKTCLDPSKRSLDDFSNLTIGIHLLIKLNIIGTHFAFSKTLHYCIHLLIQLLIEDEHLLGSQQRIKFLHLIKSLSNSPIIICIHRSRDQVLHYFKSLLGRKCIKGSFSLCVQFISRITKNEQRCYVLKISSMGL